MEHWNGMLQRKLKYLYIIVNWIISIKNRFGSFNMSCSKEASLRMYVYDQYKLGVSIIVNLFFSTSKIIYLYTHTHRHTQTHIYIYKYLHTYIYIYIDTEVAQGSASKRFQSYQLIVFRDIVAVVCLCLMPYLFCWKIYYWKGFLWFACQSLKMNVSAGVE